MSKPFDDLRDRLLRAGVAQRHVRRYVTELTEHLGDLTEAEKRRGAATSEAAARALAQLGTDDRLADAMIRRPDLRAWSVQAPWAAYLLAPPAALGVALGLGIALVMAIVETHRPDGGGRPVLPAWFGGMTAADTLFVTRLLPLLLGWGVALQAARQRMPALWPALGLGVIAVIGGSLEFAVTLPVPPDLPGELSLGFAMMPPYVDAAETAARIALNLALTLLPYLYWTWRTKPQDGMPPALQQRPIES
jgi:hypothetical protein